MASDGNTGEKTVTENATEVFTVTTLMRNLSQVLGDLAELCQAMQVEIGEDANCPISQRNGLISALQNIDRIQQYLEDLARVHHHVCAHIDEIPLDERILYNLRSALILNSLSDRITATSASQCAADNAGDILLL